MTVLPNISLYNSKRPVKETHLTKLQPGPGIIQAPGGVSRSSCSKQVNLWTIRLHHTCLLAVNDSLRTTAQQKGLSFTVV